MKNFANFKTQLEQTCSIAEWYPTQDQLQKIANALTQTKIASTNDAVAVVSEIYSGATFNAFEGIDNSDVRTLLTLAIQVANTKNG